MKLKNRQYANGLWGIFSSVVLCIYNWSIVILLWDIPSFLLRYNINDIIGYAAYQFMFALFESVLVTLFIALISFILPAKFIQNTFLQSGTALVFAFAINAVFFKGLFSIIKWITKYFPFSDFAVTQLVFGLWAYSFIALPIGFVIASKKEKVERIIIKFVENLSVLVSIYIFLSVTGTLIVIIRNVF